jgi:hypothetical protein
VLTLTGSGLLQQASETSSTDNGKDIPPSNADGPEIVGKAEVGSVVSVKPGVWVGNPAPRVRTTLLVGGVARQCPCLLRPADDGQNLVASDVASNAVGSAVMASRRMQVSHPVPQALGVPTGAAIGADGTPAAVDVSGFFIGASGGAWSAFVSDGQSSTPCAVDEVGTVTVNTPGTVNVSYSNSGGSTTIIFAVASGTSVDAPVYDGTLRDVSAVEGEPVSIAVGAAFFGPGLVFSATGLPNGISLKPGNGTIIGQSAVTGSFEVTVTATNSAGSASGTFQLDIAGQQASVAAPVYDGSLRPQKADLGGAFSLAAGAAFSGEALVFSATGLAPELTIIATTGEITGIPTAVGDFAATVMAKNSGGAASGSFTITVSDAVLAAPSYDGSLPPLEVRRGSAVFLAAGAAFAGEALTFSATGLAPGLGIDPATGDVTGTATAEGSYAATITAANMGGAATSTFTIIVTVAGTGTATAPTYNGGAGDLVLKLNQAMNPVDVSVHFTGAELAYSASGLPIGLSFDADSGVISGTPTASESRAVTISATNSGGSASAVFTIVTGTVDQNVPSAWIMNTQNLTGEGTGGTLDLGTPDAASRIFVTVIAGFRGMTDSGFTVSSGTATKLDAVTWPNRVVELWEITGVAGSSVGYSVTTAGTFIAVFRTVGYRPIGSDPLVANRQDAVNIDPSTVTATVPARGAALVHAKRYEDLVGPAGMILSHDTGSSYNAGISGYLQNQTGSASTDDYTATTQNAAGAKYLAVIILEPQS